MNFVDWLNERLAKNPAGFFMYLVVPAFSFAIIYQAVEGFVTEKLTAENTTAVASLLCCSIVTLIFMQNQKVD